MAYADLDERAIDALREFNEEGALTVLQQFKESDLSHVQVAHKLWMSHVAQVIGFIYRLLLSPVVLRRTKVLFCVES